MYVVKKRLQRTKEQFKRDNTLGFPFHGSDKSTPERDAFISSLIKNKEFVPTYTQNYERFKDSARDTIKKFNGFDYFCIAIFVAIFGGFAYAFSSINTPKSKIIQQHHDAAIIIFTLLGVLAGLGVGVGNQIALSRANKDSDNANLFYRLSVRLFDSMHEKYPDLDEKVLKACNPELARVIRALVIANISDEDAQQIQEIATNLAKKLNKMTSKNENDVLLSCNDDIKQAMSIIELNLTTNTLLYEAILNVYRGNVPVKFLLGNPQKSR